MAAVTSSDAGGGGAGAMESIFHRRIEFHPARKPYSAVSSAGASGFFLETLNPSSGSQKIVREAVLGGDRGNGGMIEKRIEGGIEFLEHGLDQELGFRITFRRIGAGLANLGNTCFLNSVLQCLTYTEPFAAYLQSGKHKSSCRTAGFCALCALQNHVMTALQSTGKILSPFHLVKNLRCISRNFRNARQEDAHEYMVNLLESMHKCCLPSGVQSESPSAYEKSLVHKIFGGRLRSQVKCMQCQYSSNKYDPFLDLSLEIAKADTLKKTLLNFTQVEKLDGGERQYQCQRCKQKVRALKQLTINKPPNVLTVHLKRFSAFVPGQKIDRKVEFEPVLDLKPFVSDPNEGHLKYTLYGVLVHAGWSTHSGHYYCFVRTSTGIWHSLDDNQVRQVSEKTVLSQKAYMLFYVRDRSPSLKSSIQKENMANASGLKINPNSNSNSKLNGTNTLINHKPSEIVKAQPNPNVSLNPAIIKTQNENLNPAILKPQNEKLNPAILKPQNEDSNPAIIKPQNENLVPMQLNGTTVNSKLQNITKLEDPKVQTVFKSGNVTDKFEEKLHEKKSEEVATSAIVSVDENKEENKNNSDDLSKDDKIVLSNPKPETEIKEENTNTGLSKDKVALPNPKPETEIIKGNNNTDLNKDKVDLSSLKPETESNEENNNTDFSKDKVDLSNPKTEINEDLLKQTPVSKDETAKIEIEEKSTKEKVKKEEKISQKLDTKSKKLMKRSSKCAYIGQNTLFLTTLMLRKNKKLKRAKKRRLVNKEVADVASTSASNEFVVKEDKSHKRKRAKKCKEKNEKNGIIDDIKDIKEHKYDKRKRAKKCREKNEVIIEDLKEDIKDVEGNLDKVKVNKIDIKEDKSENKDIKENEGLCKRESINLLMRGLTEIKVPGWDEEPRVELNNNVESSKRNIGYVPDEWDEEYDMGKRKKVKKAKDDFEGPNPFQEIADIKIKKKMKKFKSGHFGSGNQPLRI